MPAVPRMALAEVFDRHYMLNGTNQTSALLDMEKE
jgi:hypothetical protein